MALAINRNGDKLLSFYPGKEPALLADHPDLAMTFSCVVAIYQGKTLFVFNPRRNEWELPAGLIESTETPLAAAHRELQEESGQFCSTLQFSGMALLQLTRNKRLELGAIFSGTLKELLPFPPNTETSHFMLWDLKSPVKEYVNKQGIRLVEMVHNLQ